MSTVFYKHTGINMSIFCYREYENVKENCNRFIYSFPSVSRDTAFDKVDCRLTRPVPLE